MALGGEIGLDEERLHRRIGFLQDRAKVHLEQVGSRQQMNIACAGSLLRDAAASAILVEKYAEAGALLTQAGSLWVSIGLFSGYALLSMGQSQAWWSDRREELHAVSEELADAARPQADRSRSGRHERRPMMAGSAGSPRQLVDLYQSVRPHMNADPLVRSVTAMARERLTEQSTAQMGATEAPMRSYVHLLDAAVQGDFDVAAGDTLTGMVMRRTEQLQAARADEHHWRLALAPAALVDFDLMALATASADARKTVSEVARHFIGRDRAVSLPLDAARGLRR
jgi:hypothetical protein